MIDNTGEIQGTMFKKGISGNPEGRPKGSRNKATLAAQKLLEGEIETITSKVIELAKAGDMAAIKLVLERILPPRKDNPITVVLPPIATAEDTAKATYSILQAVSYGDITLSEGQALISMIEQLRKNIETQEFEKRIEKLEQLQGNTL